MTSPILFGIDPGPHTGIAVKINDEYHTATVTDPKEMWDMIYQYKPAYVAFENFARSGRIDTNMIATMELVGSIKSLCHVLGIATRLQQPQERRAFILDARRLLVNQGGHTPHEVDALAHLLLLEYRLGEKL